MILVNSTEPTVDGLLALFCIKIPITRMQKTSSRLIVVREPTNQNSPQSTIIPLLEKFKSLPFPIKNGEIDVPFEKMTPIDLSPLVFKNFNNTQQKLDENSASINDEIVLQEHLEKLNLRLKDAGIVDLDKVTDSKVLCNFSKELEVTGELFVRRRQFKDADRFYQFHVLAEPNDDVVWRCRGFVNLRICNLEEAKKYFRRSLRIKPDGSKAKEGLNLTLKLLKYLKEYDLKQKKEATREANKLSKIVVQVPVLSQKELGKRIEAKVLGQPKMRTAVEIANKVLGTRRSSTLYDIFRGTEPLSKSMVDKLQANFDDIDLREEFLLQAAITFEKPRKISPPRVSKKVSKKSQKTLAIN